jgi:hypothetical protein
MKECPKCGKNNDEDVLICDCGYEFSAHVTILDNTMPLLQSWLLAPILLCLVAPVCWIWVGMSDGIIPVVLGFLLFGVNLYTLNITIISDWGDLPLHKKTIAAITIVANIATIILICLAFYAAAFIVGD